MLLVMALLGAAAAGLGPPRRTDYDLVIAGAGRRRHRRALVPRRRRHPGDRIAALGDLSGARATQALEAKGQMVAPGFIDLLGQSELTLLVDNRAESKIRQGITSEVTGEGGSVRPERPTTADMSPGRALRPHVDWTDFTATSRGCARRGPRSTSGPSWARPRSAVGARQRDVQPSPEQLRRMDGLVERPWSRERWGSPPR